MTKKQLDVICILLSISIVGILVWSIFSKGQAPVMTYEDGIEKIDLDSIYLNDSRVEVEFAEVLVGEQEETRRLIVSTQEATVSTELSSSLIQKLDFDILKKTQRVNYTGTGYFVVDLDKLTKGDILENKEDKTVTIKINHAYLQAIEIDPNNIIVDEVKEGLLARGDIKLTVKDYNAIEKELRNQLEAKFDTAENGQIADKKALDMVKEVYEPLVKAIDPNYSVYVEFK